MLEPVTSFVGDDEDAVVASFYAGRPQGDSPDAAIVITDPHPIPDAQRAIPHDHEPGDQIRERVLRRESYG